MEKSLGNPNYSDFDPLLSTQLEPCAICYEKMRKSETYTTPCNHTFCRDCIQTWTDEKPTPDCPMCRKEIPNPLLELNAALMHSAGNGDIARVKELLQEGARANSVDVNGLTALHYAADLMLEENSMMRKSIMEILLENGAEVNKTDSNGRTVLHHVLCNFTPRKESVVSFLLAKNASVNAQGMWDQKPLRRAVRYGLENVVNILLEEGAEVNHASILDKTTVLHTAASLGHVSIARALLAKNANINAQDDLGHTPLILAAKEGRANMVQMLLDEGANAALKTNTGKRARDVGRWSCQYALSHHDWVQYGNLMLF